MRNTCVSGYFNCKRQKNPVGFFLAEPLRKTWKFIAFLAFQGLCRLAKKNPEKMVIRNP